MSDPDPAPSDCYQRLWLPSRPLHRLCPLWYAAVRVTTRVTAQATMSRCDHCVTAVGRHAEAITLLKRALAGRERVLGADHPDTRGTAQTLASWTAAPLKGQKGASVGRRRRWPRQRWLDRGRRSFFFPGLPSQW